MSHTPEAPTNTMEANLGYSAATIWTRNEHRRKKYN